MKKISPQILPDAARLLSRIIIRLKNGGDQIKSYYEETKFRMFKDLMSRKLIPIISLQINCLLFYGFSDYSDLKGDQKRMEHFASLYGVLVEYMGVHALPNSAELLGMYGRVS